MLIYRLAKRTDIRDRPDTGTHWTEEQHPMPQDDGIGDDFSAEYICGAVGWPQFFKWWHDREKFEAALLKDHYVYSIEVPDELVLVGRNQVMFRPEDATRITVST